MAFGLSRFEKMPKKAGAMGKVKIGRGRYYGDGGE